MNNYIKIPTVSSIETTQKDGWITIPREFDPADRDSTRHYTALCALYKTQRRETPLQMGTSQNSSAAKSLWSTGNCEDFSSWFPIALVL